ncbi:MAG: hypothetical protein HZA51_02640 [Planctomycetes bacterium]|nr:hypothetical protein [Planctomycetota bacterium]
MTRITGKFQIDRFVNHGNSSRFFDRWTLGILLPIAAWMIWAAGYYTVFDDEAFSCQRYVLPMREMLRASWDGVSFQCRTILTPTDRHLDLGGRCVFA